MLVGFVTTKIFYQRVAHWRGKEYSVVRDQSGCVLLVSRVHYEAGYQQYEQTYLTLPRMFDASFSLENEVTEIAVSTLDDAHSLDVLDRERFDVLSVVAD